MRTRLGDSVSGRYRPAENSLLTKHVVAAGTFAKDAGSTPAASTTFTTSFCRRESETWPVVLAPNVLLVFPGWNDSHEDILAQEYCDGRWGCLWSAHRRIFMARLAHTYGDLDAGERSATLHTLRQ